MKNANVPSLQRAAFLDRDGTLIQDRGYLGDPDDVELLPGAAELLRGLKENGFLLVIVSNQSGVGRGLFDLRAMEAVHKRCVELLAAEGICLDGAYYCTHAPSDDCECRKPRPGLLYRAARELGIDLSTSVVVGDKESDVEAGKAGGCVTAVVHSQPSMRRADFQVRSCRELLALLPELNRFFSNRR